MKHAKNPNQEGVIKFVLQVTSAQGMAGSRFAYVRNFELPDPLLPDTYIVLRIDGHSFHRQFKFLPRAWLEFNLCISI